MKKLSGINILIVLPIIIIGILISIYDSLPYKNGCDSDFTDTTFVIFLLIYLTFVFIISILNIIFKKKFELLILVIISFLISTFLLIVISKITSEMYLNSIEINAELKSKSKEIPYYESINLIIRNNNQYEIAKSPYKTGYCYEIGNYTISKDTIYLKKPKTYNVINCNKLIIDSSRKRIYLVSPNNQIVSDKYFEYK